MINIEKLTNSELEILYKKIGDKLNANKQVFHNNEFRLLAKEYCDLHSFDNKETISVTLTISDLKIKPYIESIFKNNEDRIDYDCADIDLILKDIPKVKSILNKLKNDKEELDYKIKSFAEKYDLTFDDVEGKLWEEFIANGD